MGSALWKIMSIGTRLVATKAAAQATETTWRTAAGSKAPRDRHEPDRSHVESVAFAVMSAAIMAASTTILERKVAEYYTRSTGKLAPPQLKALEKREKEDQKAGK